LAVAATTAPQFVSLWVNQQAPSVYINPAGGRDTLRRPEVPDVGLGWAAVVIAVEGARPIVECHERPPWRIVVERCSPRQSAGLNLGPGWRQDDGRGRWLGRNGHRRHNGPGRWWTPVFKVPMLWVVIDPMAGTNARLTSADSERLPSPLPEVATIPTAVARWHPLIPRRRLSRSNGRKSQADEHDDRQYFEESSTIGHSNYPPPVELAALPDGHLLDNHYSTLDCLVQFLNNW